MAWAICENLRGFAASRPPLIIFMFCLGIFAVILLTLSYVIRMESISNPDVHEDWNTFLDKFSKMKFCMANSSMVPPRSPVSSSQHYVHGISSSNDKGASQLKNISVSMMVEIHPTAEFVNIPHSLTYLTTTVNGEDLGLESSSAELEMNATFILPFQWNNTKCNKHGCDKVSIYTCMTFQAPESFFPQTKTPSSCEHINETGVEYHTSMIPHKEDPDAFISCDSEPSLQISYKLNRTLTVILSMNDQSVINLHLMHTSYFLFVMVITLFCYAIIKGKPAKKVPAHLYTDKVPTNAC